MGKAGKTVVILLLSGCFCSTLASRHLASGAGLEFPRPTTASQRAIPKRTIPQTPTTAATASGRSHDAAKRIATFSLNGPCNPELNNTSWFDGCNTCLCKNGNLAACTLRSCPKNYKTTRGCPAGSKSGDTWFAACNMFTCVKLSGGLYTTRTLNGQCWQASNHHNRKAQLYQRRTGIPHSSDDFSIATRRISAPCSKSSLWFDGCNNCRCIEGKPVLCTKLYCISNERVTAGCPSGRAAEETWYADCNRHTCIRANDGTLGTLSTVRGTCW